MTKGFVSNHLRVIIDKPITPKVCQCTTCMDGKQYLFRMVAGQEKVNQINANKRDILCTEYIDCRDCHRSLGKKCNNCKYLTYFPRCGNTLVYIPYFIKKEKNQYCTCKINNCDTCCLIYYLIKINICDESQLDLLGLDPKIIQFSETIMSRFRLIQICEDCLY
jgi:hypothetical protein